MRNSWCRRGVLAAWFILSASAASAGQLVGIVPTEPSSLPSGPFVGDSGIGTAEPNMVQITGSGIVTTNPSEVWNKDIVWDYSGDSISPGDRLCIQEEIQLFSPPSSTAPVKVVDWHETLVGGSVPLGWTLEGASAFFRVGASPFNFQNLRIDVAPGEREIWFEFDPLMVGPPGNPAPVTLVVTKYIEYLGTSVLTSGGTSAQLEVRIMEQPSVPEPHCLSLVGIGIGVLVFQRVGGRRAR